MQSKVFLLVCCIVLLFTGAVTAQDAAASDDVSVAEYKIVTETDVFGLEAQMVKGKLRNNGTLAYTNIEIFVEALDADDTVIGEGFGYVANVCGSALLDFALQPNRSFTFSTSLEMFEEGDIDELVFSISGDPIEAASVDLSQVYQGVRGVTGDEVVLVEWEDATTLRYGVGCAGDVFTLLEWYRYSLDTGISEPIDHPNAEQVTETLLNQLGLTQLTQGGEADILVYHRSFLTFPVNARRIVYQNDIHTITTAEQDGSFKRIVLDGLHRHSLQGFIWMPEGRFLAYYFGAYGEPVRYLTGTVDGQLISGGFDTVVPSVIVPGPTSDGLNAVIGGTFDGVTGYYLKSTFYVDNVLLFEAELPGNNYPAPVYYRKDGSNRFIYVVRDVESQPTLQCFYREGNSLHTLTRLPLDLDNEARAWSWMSPDNNTLAISANGVRGGLWLVDLNAFDLCR